MVYEIALYSNIQKEKLLELKTILLANFMFIHFKLLIWRVRIKIVT